MASSGIAILIMLLLFVLSKDLIVSTNRSVASKRTPNALDPFAEEIGILETNVAKSPNEEARKGAENRLQFLGREATIVAEARNAEATDGPATPVPTQFIQSTLQVINITLQAIDESSQQQWGIIDNPSVPISGMVFHAENAWKKEIKNGYVLVFAGYSPVKPDQGVIYVEIISNHTLTSRSFKASGNSGAIRIVKAVGMRLVLETSKKDTLYFDVPGLRFVNSLEEVVPTATEMNPKITPIFTETPLPPYP